MFEGLENRIIARIERLEKKVDQIEVSLAQKNNLMSFKPSAQNEELFQNQNESISPSNAVCREEDPTEEPRESTLD